MCFNPNDVRVFPFTALEWRKVQGYFRSDKAEELQIASDILNMWRCRMGNSSAVLIDITQLVLNSITIDRDSTNPLHQPENTHNLRAIHGLAIIRFVNYVNEICQPSGAKLLSILDAVSTIGIPKWVVQIRHDVTHLQMPPLTLLRNVLSFCRVWLWEHHWSQSFEKAIKDLPTELFETERVKRYHTTCNKVNKMLNVYAQWRKEHPDVCELNADQKAAYPFDYIIQLINQHTPEFLEQFVKHCLAKRATGLRNPRDPLFSMVSEKERLHYFPLMRILEERNTFTALVLELTSSVSDKTIKQDTRYLLSGWTEVLLSNFLLEDSPHYGTLSTQEWKTILKHIVLAPKFFKNHLVESILSNTKDQMDAAAYVRVQKLLKIAEKLQDGSEDEDDDILETSVWAIKDASDLQKVDIMFSCVRQPAPVGGSNWTLANVNALGALGLTVDQTADSLILLC